MLNTLSRFVISTIFVTSLFQSAYADTDLENANLARIRHVLNSLTPLINEAEQQQNNLARVQFRYDWLQRYQSH